MIIYLYFFFYVKAKTRIIQVQEDFTADVRKGRTDAIVDYM